MIESSTTIPNTKIIAANETKLMVSPLAPSSATVPSKLTGKLTATQKAVLNDKKVLSDDKIAKKLLENGANPTIIDPNGSNFITHTALRGEDGEELLNVAIEQGCDLNSNVADKS